MNELLSNPTPKRAKELIKNIISESELIGHGAHGNVYKIFSRTRHRLVLKVGNGLQNEYEMQSYIFQKIRDKEMNLYQLHISLCQLI